MSTSSPYPELAFSTYFLAVRGSSPVRFATSVYVPRRRSTNVMRRIRSWGPWVALLICELIGTGGCLTNALDIAPDRSRLDRTWENQMLSGDYGISAFDGAWKYDFRPKRDAIEACASGARYTKYRIIPTPPRSSRIRRVFDALLR